jgi:hypothetical protein
MPRGLARERRDWLQRIKGRTRQRGFAHEFDLRREDGALIGNRGKWRHSAHCSHITMDGDTPTVLYIAVEAISQVNRSGLPGLRRGGFEGDGLRARPAIFFLLCAAVPIEADTVVACFSLTLTIDTMRLLFSAVPRQKGCSYRSIYRTDHLTFRALQGLGSVSEHGGLTASSLTFCPLDLPAPVPRPLLHLLLLLAWFLGSRHCDRESSSAHVTQKQRHFNKVKASTEKDLWKAEAR